MFGDASPEETCGRNRGTRKNTLHKFSRDTSGFRYVRIFSGDDPDETWAKDDALSCAVVERELFKNVSL